MARQDYVEAAYTYQVGKEVNNEAFHHVSRSCKAGFSSRCPHARPQLRDGEARRIPYLSGGRNMRVTKSRRPRPYGRGLFLEVI